MSNKIKSILFVAYLFLMLFLVFGGLILSDYADTKAGWTLWGIAPYVGAAGFFGGIVWFYAKKKQW